MVDLLAKQAAEQVRVDSSCRLRLASREAQILDLVIFLGKLTHAANNLVRKDGVILRDSQACKKRHAVKCKLLKQSVKAIKAPKMDGAVTKVKPSSECMSAWKRSCQSRWPKVPPVQQARSTNQIESCIAARQEADF